MKPDPYRKKFKTAIKWRNLNPVFNEEFFFETRPNDLDKQNLIITVWDKDIGEQHKKNGHLALKSKILFYFSFIKAKVTTFSAH